jgi:hypothetical protein
VAGHGVNREALSRQGDPLGGTVIGRMKKQCAGTINRNPGSTPYFKSGIVSKLESENQVWLHSFCLNPTNNRY